MNLLFVAPSAYLLGGVQDWLADLVADQRQPVLHAPQQVGGWGHEEKVHAGRSG